MRNKVFNNQLMNNFLWNRNYMRPKFYNQRNQFIKNNYKTISLNYIPYQYDKNNNFNMYKNPLINFQNNMLNKANKFDHYNSKNYTQNSHFIKNYYFNPKNINNKKFIDGNDNETSFREKNVQDINKTSSTDENLSDEEKDEKEEKNNEKMENLNINDIENQNQNISKIDEKAFIQTNKKGRRLSNSSNTSDYSKCTLDTSISSNKEKDVLEEKLKNDLEEENDENKKIEAQQKEKYQRNPELLNTEILNVKVKISKDRTAIFKLKRYDDLFYTIKLFCEINNVDEQLIKPLIIKSLSALNTIYQLMNCKLDDKQINILKKIKNY